MPRSHRTRDLFLVAAVLGVDLAIWGGDRTTRWGADLPLLLIPVLSLITSVALLWRWSRPWWVFAGEWVYAFFGLLVPLYQPFAALLVALYAVARRTSPRAAFVALLVTPAPLVVDAYSIWQRAAQPQPLSFFGPLVLYVVAVSIVWVSARVGRQTESDAAERHRLDTEASVRSERLALARELHDIVAHSVSAMIMQAAGATTLVGDRDARIGQALEQIEKSGVQAMTELHRLLGLLRSVDEEATEPNAAAPGLDDVQVLVDAAERTGLEVRITVAGTPAALDESVSLTAYRVVQEALTNAMRYAGRGAVVDLDVRWSASLLVLSVRSRGGLVASAGAAGLSSTGYGLVGLSERVKLVGGRLDAGPASDGFLVQAELPTEEPDAAAALDVPFRAEDGT